MAPAGEPLNWVFQHRGEALQWRFPEMVSAVGWVSRDVLLIAGERDLFLFDLL